MASPAVTNTLTNGQTADADKLQTNFNDIIASLTDGTKSLSIDELTANDVTIDGAMTVTGNVIVSQHKSSTAKNVASITSTALAGGVALSSSSSTFSTASASLVDVTNLSVTITTTGRPVYLFLQADVGQVGQITPVGGGYVAGFIRGSTGIAQFGVHYTYVDRPAAGTYTYKLQIRATGGGTTLVYYLRLGAFEL